jgi:hypothetical protein
MNILHRHQIFYIVTKKPGYFYVMDDFGDLIEIKYSPLLRFFLV